VLLKYNVSSLDNSKFYCYEKNTRVKDNFLFW